MKSLIDLNRENIQATVQKINNDGCLIWKETEDGKGGFSFIKHDLSTTLKNLLSCQKDLMMLYPEIEDNANLLNILDDL